MTTTLPPASLFKIWNKGSLCYEDPADYAVRCDGSTLCCNFHYNSDRVCDECVVQLFSGLFDIDGNPIYEGDLLTDPSENENDMKFIYEVGLYCGSYRKPYIYKAFSHSDEVHVVGRVNSESALEFHKLRLIGNVYSTPLNVYR